MSDRSARLPALHRSLRRARARWCAGVLIRGAAWSAIAALAVLCALDLAALFGEDLFVRPAVAALGVAGAGCALTLVATAARFPGLATLARRADRQFALHERLSTALEVEATLAAGRSPGAMADALLADAERHAAVLDARQWFRLSPPRAAWAAPVLAVVAAVLSFAEPGALGRLAPVAATGVRAPAAHETAENLHRIAEIMAEDADARSDPYLRTIARTLDRLSADVERDAVSRPALAAALDRLLQHTRQAYAQNEQRGGLADGAVRTNAADRLQAALNDIRSISALVMPQVADRDKAASGAAGLEHDRRDPGPQPQQRSGAVKPPGDGPMQRPPGWADILKSFDDYDLAEADPRTQVERALAEQQRRLRSAQPAGAAQDADKGEGDQAGNGVRPLGAAANDLKGAPTGADMQLPEVATQEGARIRIEVSPDALHVEAAPPSGRIGNEWRRAPEQAIDRPMLDAEERRALERYFARSPEGTQP